MLVTCISVVVSILLVIQSWRLIKNTKKLSVYKQVAESRTIKLEYPKTEWTTSSERRYSSKDFKKAVKFLVNDLKELGDEVVFVPFQITIGHRECFKSDSFRSGPASRLAVMFEEFHEPNNHQESVCVEAKIWRSKSVPLPPVKIIYMLVDGTQVSKEEQVAAMELSELEQKMGFKVEKT